MERLPPAHALIDPPARPAPADPPTRRVAMYQEWLDLLFLHWPVPVEALRPLVPEPLEIDTHDGLAYIGLVPFAMRGIRPPWLPPLPGLSAFLETNVRTYVVHPEAGPGVWFFSLDAANSPAVWAARRFWHLPYHKARMAQDRESGTIRYRSERLRPGPTPAGCTLAYRPEGRPAPAVRGSLDSFLVDRYLLYARHGHRLVAGRVFHDPYRVQPVELAAWREDLIAAAGITRPDSTPRALYSPGVRVRVSPLWRVGLACEGSPRDRRMDD